MDNTTVGAAENHVLYDMMYETTINPGLTVTGAETAGFSKTKIDGSNIKGKQLDTIFLEETMKCQDKYEAVLTSTFLNEYIEDGSISEGQMMYEIISDEYGDFVASNLLRSIYLSNAQNHKIIRSILYMLAGFADSRFYDVQSAVLSYALNNGNTEMKDLALQCYERWGDKKYVDFLESLSIDIEYLSKYRNEIVEYLKGM